MFLKLFRKWARNFATCVSALLKHDALDQLKNGNIDVVSITDVGKKKDGKHYYHINISIEGDMTRKDLFKILWNFRRI